MPWPRSLVWGDSSTGERCGEVRTDGSDAVETGKPVFYSRIDRAGIRQVACAGASRHAHALCILLLKPGRGRGRVFAWYSASLTVPCSCLVAR